MEITIKKTVEEKVQITLPAYIKGVCHFYKVISENKAIQVTTLEGHQSINETSPIVAFSNTKEKCTKEEFNNAFNQIKEKLCDIATL